MYDLELGNVGLARSILRFAWRRGGQPGVRVDNPASAQEASCQARPNWLHSFLGIVRPIGGRGLQADPLTTAQRAAPINAALSLVMTLTGMASSRGCMRPFPTNAFMNNGPDNLASILGAMPPPK